MMIMRRKRISMIRILIVAHMRIIMIMITRIMIMIIKRISMLMMMRRISTKWAQWAQWAQWDMFVYACRGKGFHGGGINCLNTFN